MAFGFQACQGRHGRWRVQTYTGRATQNSGPRE